MHISVKLILEEMGMVTAGDQRHTTPDEVARIIWVLVDDNLRSQLSQIPRSFDGEVSDTVYDHHATIVTHVPHQWVDYYTSLDGEKIKIEVGSLIKSESIGAEAFEVRLSVPNARWRQDGIKTLKGKILHITHSLKDGVNPRLSNDALQADDREVVSEHSIVGYGTLEIVWNR